MRLILICLLLSSYFVISLPMENALEHHENSDPHIVFKKYTREKTKGRTNSNAVHRNCYRTIAFTHLLQQSSVLQNSTAAEASSANTRIKIPFLDIYSEQYKDNFMAQSSMLASGLPTVELENLRCIGSPYAWGNTTDGSPFISVACKPLSSQLIEVNSIVYSNKFLWNKSDDATSSTGTWFPVGLSNYFEQLDPHVRFLCMMHLIKNKKLLISYANQGVELSLATFSPVQK